MDEGKTIAINFEIPVALIVFNRPKETREVLLALASIRPSEIFIIADGPRDHIEGDRESCEQVRGLIDNMITWPCRIHKKFRSKNLGCGLSPAEGITWVFEHAEMAIILEDDCLPDKTFFEFCRQCLDRYKLNYKIMMISGNNHLLGKCEGLDSYFYSINTQTHGWATWRRAWEHYDFYMRDWPQKRSIFWLRDIHGQFRYAQKWMGIFDEAYSKANNLIKYDCWDFQWTYACWKNNALNIIPNKNLVSNIGYGIDATHATPLNHPLAKLKADEMQFPLRHPSRLVQNIKVDKILSKTVYGNYSLFYKAGRKLLRMIKRN
jgi:hypothetical protein